MVAGPGQWGVRRLRDVAELRVSNVDKHEKDGEIPVRLCNYVDVYKNDRITERISFMRATAAEDELARFRLRCGDVLITKDSETWTDIGVPALVEYEAPDLVSGYHLALLRPQRERIEGAFLLRALQSADVAHQFHVRATGVTRFGLSHTDIKSVLVPVPPLAEQAAIVRFLDYADRRIRRAIRAKQTLIGLLNEQKQAVIHRAITRGLDSNVRLKPSGVDWLGDVPEHWEVVPLKRRISFQEGPGIMAADFRDEGTPLLRISCLANDEATLQGCNYLDPEDVLNRWSHFAVRAGDYLLSASGSLGAVSLATDVVAGSIPYTGILRLWPADTDSVDMRYVRYFIASELFHAQIRFMKAGVGIEHFGPTHLKRMLILLPPLEEQRKIAASLTVAAGKTDAGASEAQREIALLREYRARLVSDVVTGKLDVRAAAAQLPDEAEEAETLDEFEVEQGDESEIEGLEPVEA
jgi:type I restriction enzyme S subunit